jgi:hypothetical protein
MLCNYPLACEGRTWLIRTSLGNEFLITPESSVRTTAYLACPPPAQLSGWSYQTIQFVATAPVMTLDLINPSSTPDYKRYTIDDVAIRKVPGAVLTARLAPIVTVEGMLGAKYQIQSATNLTAPMWTTLTNLTLSNNPTFFMDTNSYTPGAPFQRVYRAVRIQ